jgi:hypothetical protein
MQILVDHVAGRHSNGRQQPAERAVVQPLANREPRAHRALGEPTAYAGVEFTSYVPIGWSLVTLGEDCFLRIPILDGTGSYSEFPDDEQFLARFWATSYCARHRSPFPKDIAVVVP